MDNNKASVKIYGQEYIIAGEQPREHIVKVAAYVDSKMHEMADKAQTLPTSTMAVLTAVNVGDEYFSAREELKTMSNKLQQLENEADRYEQLWEEAKKSFVQYKEDNQKAAEEKEVLEQELAEVKEKCRELENSFFDLQMENIQLKKAMNKLKRD